MLPYNGTQTHKVSDREILSLNEAGTLPATADQQSLNTVTFQKNVQSFKLLKQNQQAQMYNSAYSNAMAVQIGRNSQLVPQFKIPIRNRMNMTNTTIQSRRSQNKMQTQGSTTYLLPVASTFMRR